MTNYVTVKQLAKDIGLDSSNARKYVLKQGFEFTKIRTRESGNQFVNALSEQDAETIKLIRQRDGYMDEEHIGVSTNKGPGYFYVIQLVPELDPLRIKFGFASNVDARLSAHRTSAPTAELVKAWTCKQSWERAVIDSVTRIGCQLIASEVFVCDDLGALIERCNQFFALMS